MVSRASDILRIDETHFEDTQLLRYRTGQYYRRHSDFIDAHLSLPMGPRILTLYVHLSDGVSGGGTHFPELNATVLPKAGRAVLWPSVLSDSPRRRDPRSDHEALPVEAGSPNSVNYGANIWVHQRNFKEALARACA
jgi:prolyl 4-hydroxylase